MYTMFIMHVCVYIFHILYTACMFGSLCHVEVWDHVESFVAGGSFTYQGYDVFRSMSVRGTLESVVKDSGHQILTSEIMCLAQLADKNKNSTFE